MGPGKALAQQDIRQRVLIDCELQENYVIIGSYLIYLYKRIYKPKNI